MNISALPKFGRVLVHTNVSGYPADKQNPDSRQPLPPKVTPQGFSATEHMVWERPLSKKTPSYLQRERPYTYVDNKDRPDKEILSRWIEGVGIGSENHQHIVDMMKTLKQEQLDAIFTGFNELIPVELLKKPFWTPTQGKMVAQESIEDGKAIKITAELAKNVVRTNKLPSQRVELRVGPHWNKSRVGGDINLNFRQKADGSGPVFVSPL